MPNVPYMTRWGRLFTAGRRAIPDRFRQEYRHAAARGELPGIGAREAKPSRARHHTAAVRRGKSVASRSRERRFGSALLSLVVGPGHPSTWRRPGAMGAGNQ